MDTTAALDIVKHNYDDITEVVNAPNHPRGITFPVSYTPSMEQVVTLINISSSCCQYLRYDCYHSMLGKWSSYLIDKYWKDRHGDWKSYFPGGPVDGIGCSCQFDYSCGGGTVYNFSLL